MWPVDVLLFPLPDSFQAFEDEHFFELRCRKCGQTVATFSAPAAQPEEILKAARAHRCPTPVYFKHCVRCGREIDVLKMTCPYCGADNSGPDF